MGRKKKPSNEFDYLPVDRYQYVNVDDDLLKPIRIDQLDILQRTYKQYGLPPPEDFPPLEDVAGYGLPPSEQVFEREVIPDGIKKLERQIRLDLRKAKNTSTIKRELTLIERFWDTIEGDPEKYSTEIEWLRQMWRFRLLGKFLFINGKATYIVGHYWFFLNWWTMNTVIPEYRDRDRRCELSVKFAETDTTTFAKINEQSRLPELNDVGEYDMLDLGRKICFGTNHPKHRRCGETSRSQAEHCEYITRTVEKHSAIQAKDDETATKIFQEHFVHAFTKLPVFWKPLWDGSGGIRPKNNMLFDSDDPYFGLHNRVTFATSSDSKKYDGDIINRMHLDESGKFSQASINEVVGVVKFCLSTGGGMNINGKIRSTSTVDELSGDEKVSKAAGENYLKLCMDSMYHERDDNGQTRSGMYNIFFKASDGLQGFVDKFGGSIEDDPTPEQAKYIGNTIGARKYIKNKVNEYKRKKDWEGLSMFRRQHPMSFKECFAPPSRTQFFNREMLESRLVYLTFEHREELPRRGNFIRESYPDGRVLWVDDDQTGRFYLSFNFKPDETNLRENRNGVWFPKYQDKFVASADTFGLDRPLGRASMGGGAVRYRRDFFIDPEGKDLNACVSDRFIITYNFRPDTVEEYAEDMLMMSQYCGAMMYPERNKTNVIDHFRKRGYEGYLLYDVDRITGHRRPEPGWWNGGEGNKMRLAAFNAFRDEVNKNSKRMYHPDLIQELLDIRDPKDMTNYDLFTAAAGCLLAERNPYYEYVQKSQKSIDTSDWMSLHVI
jgi:hypothetical protein